MSSSPTTMLTRHSTLVTDFTDADLPSLRQALSALTDPRHRRGIRYPFAGLLLIFTAAVISGQSTLTGIAEWAADACARGVLTHTTTAPSVATIHRIAAQMDAAAFDTVVTEWIAQRTAGTTPTGTGLKAIAVDGKEVRGAKHVDHDRVFLMAAFDHSTGTVIGQESVDAKTNEIPHLPGLLDQLGDLDSRVITADALHTLAQQAEAITARGGHYLFTVKTNAKSLHTQLAQASWARTDPQYTCNEKAHGRISGWHATGLECPLRITFPQAAQIMRLHRSQSGTDRDDSGEIVYAITSLTHETADAANLARLLRGHWGIENRLHWVRDTTFDEDRSQVRTGGGARVMAVLRNLAISIHRLAGQTNIAAASRYYNRHPELAIEITRL